MTDGEAVVHCIEFTSKNGTLDKLKERVFSILQEKE